MLEFGQQIRQLRELKGVSLNQFAKELDVSPAYLSNLEKGKTETIQLPVLSKIQEKLLISYLSSNPSLEVDVRIQHACSLLQALQQQAPEKADFLLHILEKGLQAYQVRG